VTAPTILVADDDFDTRIILRTVLERHTFKVIDAATADDALAAARTAHFDLVILNYPMLCEDGHTLVERLRESPNARGCPILNLTSRVVPRMLEMAAAQGVNKTLPKPIDVEQLLRVVGELTAVPAT
jgi:two-component system, chemotaxis family, chemotaxis protein CheY